MKSRIPIYLFSLLLWFPSTLSAVGVKFFEGTWEEALAESARSGKGLLLQASTEWCGWCKVIDREIFPDSAVGAKVNDAFIAVELDFEKGIGPDLAMKFRVGNYPTTLFFNSSGQLVHTLVGYPGSPERFLDACDSALAVTEEQPYAFDSRDLNVPFPDFYRSSFNGGGGFGSATPDEEVVVHYLDEQQDLFNEISWSVLWRFGGGETYERYVLEEMEEYAERYGLDQVRSVTDRLLHRLATQAADDGNDEGLEEIFLLLDRYNLSDNPAFAKLNYERYYAERSDAWDRYAEVSWQMIRQNGEENVGEIAHLCRKLSDECSDQSLLSEALTWMKPPLTEEPTNHHYLQTWVTLLYQTGQLDEAAREARRALEIGKKNGEETSGLQRVLNLIASAQDRNISQPAAAGDRN